MTPRVLTEWDTLDLVRAGHSLARFGDGEFALCRGRSIPCQRHDPALAGRLRGILRLPHEGRCLVGIPHVAANSPKAAYWTKHLAHAADFLVETSYASAFITRPDSAPWIDARPFWAALESLWRDQDVTLVRGGGRSFTAADLTGARSVTEVIGPRLDAWASYRDLLTQIGRPTRALLCLGPTATVMAVDLCAYGVHAIDIGHAGMFYRKHLAGLPMTVTKQDSAA